jgi:hypothetical protein
MTKHIEENDELSDGSETDIIDNDEKNVIENKENVTQPEKPKRVRPAKHKTIKSECGNDIILKYRNKETKNKPIVVYYEDLVEEKPQPVIIKKKRGKGRPRKNPIIQYVDGDGNNVNDKSEAQQTIINAPVEEKMSEKDLKMIELQQRIMELETVSGKKIRATKKGNIDKRQTKEPTEKQLQARKKFLEAGKLRRERLKMEKENKNKIENKENVKQVLDELTEIKKEKLKQEEELRKKIVNEDKKIIEDNKYGKYGADIFK